MVFNGATFLIFRRMTRNKFWNACLDVSRNSIQKLLDLSRLPCISIAPGLMIMYAKSSAATYHTSPPFESGFRTVPQMATQVYAKRASIHSVI